MSNTGLPSNAMRDVRATSKEWRVTEGHRGNAKMFVAPDLSPVGTHATEMAKGLRGWTDLEAKPQVVDGDTLAKQARIAEANAEAQRMTVGHVCPKRRDDAPKRNVMSVDMTDREYEQYRALMRAAREHYGYDNVG